MNTKKLPFKILFVLSILSLSCQSQENKSESMNIYEGRYNEASLILENGKKLTPDIDDISISSFFISNRNDIYIFDLLTARIYKINMINSEFSYTGGFGRGPGEFLREGFKIITYCGNDYFFAIDWFQARLQLFDLDLQLINIISLNGIPYDLICIDDNKLAVQYSNDSRVDIISHDGVLHEELHPNIPYGNTKELQFRHFVLNEEGIQYFAYFFIPIFQMVDKNGSLMKELILSKLEPDEIHTAVRDINILDNEIHLFYNNINPNLAEREKKRGHVFDLSDGEYLYSYRVPHRINNYMFESNKRFIALEDSLKSIVIYNFRIEGNE